MADRETIDDFDQATAEALGELLADPQTSNAVRLQIINELLDEDKGQSFFDTIFKEEMSKGNCPSCNHENHWAIPEEELNIRGWITHEIDKRVKQHSNEETCKEFAEACSKKKTTC